MLQTKILVRSLLIYAAASGGLQEQWLIARASLSVTVVPFPSAQQYTSGGGTQVQFASCGFLCSDGTKPILPPLRQWEVRFGANGQTFYLDWVNHSMMWVDPYVSPALPIAQPVCDINALALAEAAEEEIDNMNDKGACNDEVVEEKNDSRSDSERDTS